MQQTKTAPVVSRAKAYLKVRHKAVRDVLFTSAFTLGFHKASLG